jgi:hypothetical protein
MLTVRCALWQRLGTQARGSNRRRSPVVDSTSKVSASRDDAGDRRREDGRMSKPPIRSRAGMEQELPCEGSCSLARPARRTNRPGAPHRCVSAGDRTRDAARLRSVYAAPLLAKRGRTRGGVFRSPSGLAAPLGLPGTTSPGTLRRSRRRCRCGPPESNVAIEREDRPRPLEGAWSHEQGASCRCPATASLFFIVLLLLFIAVSFLASRALSRATTWSTQVGCHARRSAERIGKQQFGGSYCVGVAGGRIGDATWMGCRRVS